MKLVIFDVGGVMVDGFDVAPAMASDFGMPLDDLRAQLVGAGDGALHDGTTSVAEFWERFASATGHRPAGEPWGDYFRPTRRPAMYALAERLKADGARVVAGTNTIEPHYRRHLDQGDYGVFHHVYASNLMGVSKPRAEFWQQILTSEGTEPGNALFIDDLPENVAGAAALGITAVQYLDVDQVTAAVEAFLG